MKSKINLYKVLSFDSYFQADTNEPQIIA